MKSPGELIKREQHVQLCLAHRTNEQRLLWALTSPGLTSFQEKSLREEVASDTKEISGSTLDHLQILLAGRGGESPDRDVRAKIIGLTGSGSIALRGRNGKSL